MAETSYFPQPLARKKQKCHCFKKLLLYMPPIVGHVSKWLKLFICSCRWQGERTKMPLF
jgi:hypothetical protein